MILRKAIVKRMIGGAQFVRRLCPTVVLKGTTSGIDAAYPGVTKRAYACRITLSASTTSEHATSVPNPNRQTTSGSTMDGGGAMHVKDLSKGILKLAYSI